MKSKLSRRITQTDKDRNAEVVIPLFTTFLGVRKQSIINPKGPSSKANQIG